MYVNDSRKEFYTTLLKVNALEILKKYPNGVTLFSLAISRGFLILRFGQKRRR